MNPIRYIRIKVLERKAHKLEQLMINHNELADSIDRLDPMDCAIRQSQYYEAKREFTKVCDRIWSLKNGL